MAGKKNIVDKALAGLKAAAKGASKAGATSGLSEKIVAIPEVMVFSELPFSRVGAIGGTGPNVVVSQAEPGSRKPAKAAAPMKKTAASMPASNAAKTSSKPSATKKVAKKSSAKKSPAKKTAKRKKTR